MPSLLLGVLAALLIACSTIRVGGAKALIGITVVWTVFCRSIVQLTGQTGLESVDDLLVALSFVYTFLKGQHLAAVPGGSPGRRVPNVLVQVGISLFVLAGVLSSLVNGAGLSSLTLSGAFLALKGMLFLAACSRVSWSRDDLKALEKGINVVAVVVAVAISANLIFPGWWTSTFSSSGEANVRYGMSSLIGPFVHPFDLAFVSGILTIWYLSGLIRARGARTRKIAAILIFSVSLILTFRRKDLIGLGLGVSTLAAVSGWWGAVLLICMGCSLAALLGSNILSSQFAELVSTYGDVQSPAARTALYIGGSSLAHEYFPLGAGFGRFGSRTAAVHYSPEYIRLNLDGIWGLGDGPDNGFFLTDTSWPALLGETGIFGVIGFVIALTGILLSAINVATFSRAEEYAAFGTAAAGVMVFIATESVGAAVFTSPPVYVVLFGMGGVCLAINRDRCKSLSAVTDSAIHTKDEEVCRG